MKVRGHRVLVDEVEGGFKAFVPTLPGCEATADTRAGAKARIVKAIAFTLNERRTDESPCTCRGALGKPSGCPVHGRRETREELEALRLLKEAVHDLTWNALDGFDRAAPAIVERNSFNR